jgi:hypothetical protein
VLSDIEIANAAELRPITEVARDELGIPAEHLVPYGHHKAKVDLNYLASLADRPQGRLILMTALSPTPPGEGKTTTTVGLTDALHGLGHRSIACLREPAVAVLAALPAGQHQLARPAAALQRLAGRGLCRAAAAAAAGGGHRRRRGPVATGRAGLAGSRRQRWRHR